MLKLYHAFILIDKTFHRLQNDSMSKDSANNYWQTKSLSQMTEDEWESLCDGCGLCCYRKIIDGYLFWKKILKTKVACNLLDCSTCRCRDYENRFSKQSECIKLDRKKLKTFKWLPETCAYRLIMEKKPLPPWHPLVSGTRESVLDSGVCIKDGINEEDADDWYDYIIE